MMAWLVEWADDEFNDMLGYIYMHLELGSKRSGQFFTPYHLCSLMAKISDFEQEIIAINEPTCGAGGNIIAFAEAMKQRGVNYQNRMIAICQDIDIKAVYMTYVQLSLYGIPAIVYQTDTLMDPLGIHSGTGKLYTVGYMLNPKFWKKWNVPENTTRMEKSSSRIKIVTSILRPMRITISLSKYGSILGNELI